MFETASSAELLPITQGERKYLLEASTANDIWLRASARLKPHPRDASRPITFHRTTYFDTPEHDYYRGTGPVARRIRVREYATARSPDSGLELMRPCFLELKQSANGQRSKRRVEMVDAGDMDRHLERAGSRLVPCLTTWYQRAALTDSSESIRLTLDSDIRYCPPQPIGAPLSAAPTAFACSGSLILEVKAWGPLPAWLQALVRWLQEADNFSKFCAGMQASGVRW